MRINKYIAQAGIASRRGADELITKGKVKVNGAVLTEPGYDVKDGDHITVNGEPITASEQKVYYIMNKPTGFITSVRDERGRRTVLDLMPDVEARIFPVGRLDYNTSGLLFLTNDGDLAYGLTHPKHEVGKTYRVLVAGNIPKAKLAVLRHGVDIGGFTTSPAKVDVITWNRHSMLLEITIHEGKYRQVRRMFDAVGYPVQELTRISVGNIKLGHLKIGQYRKLSQGEIDYLKSISR
ncbi:MAG: rRNA pseudouridine synthase [Eubacterium sp.]|nr:rRNA pseudouridine synthase [Eubacterium sp.]